MSIFSDISNILSKKFPKEAKNVMDDYREWILNLAINAGLTNKKYDFTQLLADLIEKIEFLDTRKNYKQGIIEYSDNDTLSRFMTYLESKKEKNQDIINMVAQLSEDWEQNNTKALLDHDFTKSFLSEYKQFENKMKQAYQAHEKFEQLYREDSGDKKEKYYSFFQLNDKEDKILNAITFNEKTMNLLLTQTDLIKMHIIQQGNGKYSLSLGIEGSVDDIITQIQQLQQTKKGSHAFYEEGIYRDGSKDLIDVEKLNTEFGKLINATSGENRTLISSSGDSLKGNRLTELLFNQEAISDISAGKAFQYYLDQVSSLVGLDVNYAEGGGVSVKTFGSSGIIQLMAHGSMNSVADLFLYGQGRKIKIPNTNRTQNALTYRIEKAMSEKYKDPNLRTKIITDATLEAKKMFSDRLFRISEALDSEVYDKNYKFNQFSMKDFIGDSTLSTLKGKDDDAFVKFFNQTTGNDLFRSFAAELDSDKYSIAGLLNAAKIRLTQGKVQDTDISKMNREALFGVLTDIRRINEEMNEKAGQIAEKEFDKILRDELSGIEGLIIS